MILFMRDPKAHQESVLRLTNAFIKMVGSKMNIQKSAAFLYTNDKHVENEIEETIPFSVASRKEKKRYLQINIIKERCDETSKH